MASIDIKKTPSGSYTSHSDDLSDSSKIQEMEEKIQLFLLKLEETNEKFDPEKAFDAIHEYITNYDRMFYSTISNFIYSRCEEKGEFDIAGTLLSNLEALVRYSQDPRKLKIKQENLCGNQTKKNFDDAKKIILKIWDHVTLANHQYNILKQSDEEYDEKFKKRIAQYQEKISKEMSSQMLTMVSIFTALAFLIFGSISSLDGIFENKEIPLIKTISIGLVWGICILNMIFVFLYCTCRIINVSLKSTQYEKNTFFSNYPMVCWVNLILFSLLIVSLWIYFVQQNDLCDKLIKFTQIYSTHVFLSGSVLIVVLITATCCYLANKTKN